MDPALERCLDNLLARGTDDWCGPVDVLVVAARAGGTASPQDRLRAARRIVEAALAGSWVEAGDADETGFQPWNVEPAEAVRRIEDALQTHMERREPYGWFWLCNTPEGDRRGEAALARSEAASSGGSTP